MFKDIQAIEYVHQCMYIFAVRYTYDIQYVFSTSHEESIQSFTLYRRGGGGRYKNLGMPDPLN